MEVNIKNREEVPSPYGKCNAIYIDPPWEYLEGHEGIYRIPIQILMADNCILFLRATFPVLPTALRFSETLGFEHPKVGLVWIKANQPPETTEICLIAKRGKPSIEGITPPQILYSPVEENNKKRDIIKEKIVQLIGDLPLIELLTTERVEGNKITIGTQIKLVDFNEGDR